MSPARIELEIQEFVLHGFSPLDRHAVAEAVRLELAARVASESPRAFASADLLDAGRFDAPPGPDAGALAAGVARSIAAAAMSQSNLAKEGRVQ